MTKILTTVGSLFLFGISEAQLSSTENYVYTRTYLDYNGTTASKTSETVQYFDGLGRPKQVVNVKASPLQNDIITHIEYDGFGRQSKEYLPIPQPNTMNGAIISNPLSNATQPSIYGSEKIYSEKVLENSPLDRIQQQIHVGNDWSQKPVKFDYDANIAGEVIKFTTTTTWVNNATKSEISNSGSYGTAQLYKNTVTDEDGNKTIEFKNGQGQVLLVRKVLDATQSADTYYVYNEYNQLAFVIPPLASIATLNETTLNNLCYQYRYDGRSRLVEKKLPGKGWEYMVYDKVDRLVATQDPNQKLLNKWLFTKYDKFGRVLYTGISIDNGDRNAVQTWVTNTYGINVETAGTYTQSGLQIYYANTAYPQNIESILSVNYYDSYLTGDPFPTMVYDQIVLPSDVQQYGVSTKGLPVSSFVKNIQDDNWTKTYMYYDLKGRLIREYSQNHLGGYTNIEKRIDFSGNPNIILTQHKRLSTDTEKVIVENFTYDHQNRLLTHTHQVDSNAVEYLAQNEYNELSQLKNKKVGGTSANSPLQQVDYQYNIRGWVKQINNPNDLSNGDLFGYRINYNSPSTGYWTQRYNGNISEIDWATQSDNVLRRYVYMYDSLNRLTGGYYLEPNSSIVWAGTFNENYTYDLNGNITKLVRTGKSPVSQTTSLTIDDLTYVYNGNKLNSVSDAAQNSSGYPIGGNMISYDDNGNMTNHMDKNISKIEYNHLNLPTLVNAVVGGGWLPGLDAEGPRHTYKYKANGTKYAKRVDNISPYMQEFTEVDYLDGFQYERKYTKMNTAQNPYDTGIVLKFAPTSEGYFDFEKNKYIYNYSDHLGNTRLSYFHNGSSIEVLEENNYYPFGLKHEGYNGLAGNPSYQYKYNGKELQETGMYDYGARFYMPDIGRWGVVDPLAEHSQDKTPYHYCSGNPINRLDPNGMCDDPNCSHGGLRRAWDSVGRFFGGWGSAEKKQAKAEITEFGPLEKLGQWLDEPVDAGTAQAASDLTHNSIPGNFTVPATNEGVILSIAAAFGSAMQAANGFRYPAYKGGTKTSPAASGIKLKNYDPQVGESFQTLGTNISNGKISVSDRSVTHGKFDFVVTNDGSLKLGTGHFNLSNGANSVQAAGQLKLYNGQVMMINNNSGHYLPTTSQAQIFPTILSNIGVDVSKAKLKTYTP